MTGTIVFDASALVGVLLVPEDHPHAVALIGEGNKALLVPQLCDLEVVSVLGKMVRRGVIDLRRAESALSLYLDLPLQRHGHTHLLRRCLSLRENFTAYDAVYVALAEAVHAHLCTTDQRLMRGVRDHTKVVAVAA